MGALNGEAMLGGVATSDSGDSVDQPLIVTIRPSDYGQMVEMTGFSEEPLDDSNALWVVDDTGEMNDTLSVPLDSYARVFITPVQAGTVVVEQLYPDDQSQNYSMGMIEPYHTYGIWFYGGMLGTYQMRYNVNGGEYSNIVEFYVGAQEDVQEPLTVWSGWP
jgi:hypothetical protein